MTSQPSVVVFDGFCVLCSRSVAWVAAHDPEGAFAFTSSGSPAAVRLLSPLGIDSEAPGSIVLVQGGTAHTRSEAVLRIAAGLPAPWSWLAVLRFVPRRVRDVFYDLVARHRYRWFGRKDECGIPSPAVRGRLL